MDPTNHEIGNTKSLDNKETGYLKESNKVNGRTWKKGDANSSGKIQNLAPIKQEAKNTKIEAGRITKEDSNIPAEAANHKKFRNINLETAIKELMEKKQDYLLRPGPQNQKNIVTLSVLDNSSVFHKRISKENNNQWKTQEGTYKSLEEAIQSILSLFDSKPSPQDEKDLKTLGLKPGATLEDINKAYRRLVAQDRELSFDPKRGLKRERAEAFYRLTSKNHPLPETRIKRVTPNVSWISQEAIGHYKTTRLRVATPPEEIKKAYREFLELPPEVFGSNRDQIKASFQWLIKNIK